jgi:HEPN domain-containing protein
MDPKQELVRNWLEKARRDLDSAHRLASSPDPYFDTAIYHCQQAAEKALKGWLVYHDQRFEKIHDLRVLVSTAEAIETGFIEFYESAERLTPYATVYRYPGEVFHPDFEEFNQAFQDAENILNFVLNDLKHK